MDIFHPLSCPDEYNFIHIYFNLCAHKTYQNKNVVWIRKKETFSGSVIGILDCSACHSYKHTYDIYACMYANINWVHI